MDTHRYISYQRGSRKKLKRRITAAVIAVLVILAAAFLIGKLTENSPEYQLKVSLVEENRVLREEVDELTARIAELENTVSAQEQYISELPTEAPAEADENETAAETGSAFTSATPRDN